MRSSFARRASRLRGGTPFASAGGGGPPAPSMGALSFSGAADWWAGTKAGTHQEVWAGNTSRDTLTMGYAPVMPVAPGTATAAGGPGIVYHNGCAYVPYGVPASGQMTMGIAKFTYATGTWAYHTFETVAELDDHNKVVVHLCSDGKLVAMVARHTIYGQNLTWWKSTNAEDISSWSARMQKSLTLAQPNYPTIARFASHSNRTYVILRDAMYAGGSGDGGIWYVCSTDEFATTANVDTGTKIIASPSGAAGGNSGLYFFGSTNEDDRIDLGFFHFYDNSVSPGVLNDIVHAYLTEAAAGQLAVKASDGTTLGTPAIGSTGSAVAYASFDKTNKSLIYDTSADTGNYRVHVLDIQTYDGLPAISVGRFTDGATNTEQDYLRYDWSGSAWSSEKMIWNAPGDGVNGPIGTGAYATYVGGARLDPSDPNLMYICVGNQSGTSRLKKLVSNDLFVANRTVTEPFTQCRRHNVRCVIPFNLAGDHIGKMDVLWAAGRYTSALSFHCMMVTPHWNGAVHAFDMNESSGTPADKLIPTGGYSAPANVGSPTLGVTGINNGKAVSFNGTNTAINLGYANPIGDATVAAILGWFNIDSLAATIGNGCTDGSGGRKFWGTLNTNEWLLGVGSSSAGSSLGATGVTTGQWMHWGVLIDTSGGNPRLNIHLDGVSKFTHTDGFAESGLACWIGAINNNGSGANWMPGDMCQFVEDWAAGRNAAWIAAVKGYAAAGTFTSATKTASVTNGPVVGPTVTPSATLPTGASYTLKLISTSTPAGQTKTGTASTPIVFDGVTIADGDSVSIEIAAASSDKTVAPSFTSFQIAA